jgi:hypothetical protein
VRPPDSADRPSSIAATSSTAKVAARPAKNRVEDLGGFTTAPDPSPRLRTDREFRTDRDL